MSLPSNTSTYITLTVKIGAFQGGETELNSSICWFFHPVITSKCSQSYFRGLVCNQRLGTYTHAPAFLWVYTRRAASNYCQDPEGTPYCLSLCGPPGLSPPCPGPRTPFQPTGAISSCPSKSAAGLVCSSPEPCPARPWDPWARPTPQPGLVLHHCPVRLCLSPHPDPHPQADVLAWPQPVPREVPDGRGSGGPGDPRLPCSWLGQ